MPVYEIKTRMSKINSCALTKIDLKKLCELLMKKVKEARNFELNESKVFENMNSNQISDYKDRINQSFKLTIQVFDTEGKIILGDESTIFNDENFPNSLSQVIFDSSVAFKYATNREPMNRIVVNFDFKKAKIFDFSYPSTKNDPNNSSITVAGTEDTWVRGVFDTINTFIKEKKKKRSWIHSEIFYNLYLYLVFYPVAFWSIYRTSEHLKGIVPTVLSLGIYLYIFIFMLFVSRILFNYAKWIFPFIEFSPDSGTKMGKHRAFLSGILLLFSPLIIDIVKYIAALLT